MGAEDLEGAAWPLDLGEDLQAALTLVGVGRTSALHRELLDLVTHDRPAADTALPDQPPFITKARS